MASIFQRCSLAKAHSYYLIMPIVVRSIIYIVNDPCCNILAIEQVNLQSFAPVTHENAKIIVAISLPERKAKHRGWSEEVDLKVPVVVLTDFYPTQGWVKTWEIFMDTMSIINEITPDLHCDWDLPCQCVISIHCDPEVKLVIPRGGCLCSGWCVTQ